MATFARERPAHEVGTSAPARKREPERLQPDVGWRRLATRAATIGEPAVERMCAECEEELVHRHPSPEEGRRDEHAPPIVREVLRSGHGRPLDTITRRWFELRLRQDLGDIRVHTDSRASDSAEAVNALAYTVGRDVVFRRGYFAPGTAEGRTLLAHELAHAVQQRPVSNLDDLSVSPPDSPGEREARAMASRLEAGTVSHTHGAPQVQREIGELAAPEESAPAGIGPGPTAEGGEEQSCAGWELDPQSFAIMVANRVFRGRLGRSSSILPKTVQCSSDTQCRVTYENGESVDVTITPGKKVASGETRLESGKILVCTFRYRCLRSGKLVLSDEVCSELWPNPYQ